MKRNFAPAFFGILLLFMSSTCFAQEALTEQRILHLARTATPTSAIAAASDSAALAREQTAGRFANPTLGWDRESVGSLPGNTQDIFRVTLPIQVARPLTTRSLAAAESAWERAETSEVRAESVLSTILLYYEVVLLEQQLRTLADSLSHLEEAARILVLHEQAGRASGYESTRLAIASELTRSRHAEVQGSLDGARSRLATILGLNAGFTVPQSLPLLSAAEENKLAEDGIEEKNSIKLASLSAQLAQEAQDRARWTWLPTLELGAGLKHINGPGQTYGYAVGVGLELPLFDSGQALRQQAQATAALSKARVDSLRRHANADVQELLAVYRAAREELERFESRTADQMKTILDASRSGYLEGERSIVELLDAQRAQADVADRRISLLGRAKRTEARLRAAVGEFK